MKILIHILIILTFICVALLMHVKLTKKPIDFQIHIFENIVFIFHLDENELIIGFYNF
jgi:hypothetical protein